MPPPASETYHVEPGPRGGWQVRRGEESAPLCAHATQAEAVDWLHAQVPKRKGVEFLLHRRDGWARALSGRKPRPVSPPPAAPPDRSIVFATDDAAHAAAEKVFRLHAALLAELVR